MLTCVGLLAYRYRFWFEEDRMASLAVKESLEARARGSMLGLLVGDALGAPVEGFAPWEIEKLAGSLHAADDANARFIDTYVPAIQMGTVTPLREFLLAGEILVVAPRQGCYRKITSIPTPTQGRRLATGGRPKCPTSSSSPPDRRRTPGCRPSCGLAATATTETAAWLSRRACWSTAAWWGPRLPAPTQRRGRAPPPGGTRPRPRR